MKKPCCVECGKIIKGEPLQAQLVGQIRYKKFCDTDCAIEYYAGDKKVRR